jgi:hypothetical protein
MQPDRLCHRRYVRPATNHHLCSLCNARADVPVLCGCLAWVGRARSAGDSAVRGVCRQCLGVLQRLSCQRDDGRPREAPRQSEGIPDAGDVWSYWTSSWLRGGICYSPALPVRLSLGLERNGCHRGVPGALHSRAPARVAVAQPSATVLLARPQPASLLLSRVRLDAAGPDHSWPDSHIYNNALLSQTWVIAKATVQPMLSW